MIIHIAPATVFLPKFIEAINRNFSHQRHVFFLSNHLLTEDLVGGSKIFLEPVSIFRKIPYFLNLITKLVRSDRIILHGLFDPKVWLLFFLLPFAVKKSCWVIWGSDLYSHKFNNTTWKHKIREFLKTRIISNLHSMITYLDGDYRNAVKWYGSRATHIECLMYDSNVFSFKPPTKASDTSKIRVIVGNSADPTNCHLDVFKKLQLINDPRLEIYCPLSYGDEQYRDFVISTGRDIFGKNFFPLTELLPINDYIEFLSNADIGIFNHPFQQAMGNIINLLGLNKKVFLRENTSQWELFNKLGVGIFSVDELTYENIFHATVNNNQLIRDNFSESGYLLQLKEVFRT